MRLGFHYHVPFAVRDGRAFVPSYIGLFLEQLGSQVSQLVCFLHEARPDEEGFMDYPLVAPNIRIVPIGAHAPLMRRLVLPIKGRRRVRREIAALDLIMIRAPTPLIGTFERLTRSKATAVLVVGDYVKSASGLNRRGLRRVAISIWARLNRRAQDRLALRSQVLANNGESLEYYRARSRFICSVRTSTIRVADIVPPSRLCATNEKILLYAGRYSPDKGIFLIIEALAILRSRGWPVRLRLVGWDDSNTGMVGLMHQRAAALGVAEFVDELGFKSAGEDLLAIYRSSDVFVTASVFAEGFPRTIWESMACGTPVVATGVGSIPQMVEGGALLAEPGSAVSIADHVESLFHDPDLRQRIVSRASEIVRLSTIEATVSEMVRYMKQWLASRETR